MKFKLSIPTLFFLFIFSNAMSQIKITGKILDSYNKPIDLAEIMLLTTNNSEFKIELSNEKGNFQIKTIAGNYVLKIKKNEVILYSNSISVDKDTLLDVIKVDVPKNLQGVIVSSKKKTIEKKIDRLVFNVENSISSTGGDALESLKLTPGIRVQNDKITMIGKNSLSVMIDDRLILVSGDDLINYLKTIPSDNIKSIEVITTPPSKYDAEGNGGLINIRLKKVKVDSWSASLRGSYRKATYGSENFGSNFMYHKNKISVLADLSFFDRHSIYENRIEYTYPTEFWKNTIDINNRFKGLATKFNIEYELSSKTKIGIQYNGSKNRTNSNEEDRSSIYNLNLTSLNKLFLSNGNTINDGYNHSLNLNLIHKIDSIGKKISFDIDYFINNKDKKNPFNTTNINYQNPQENNYFTSNNSLQKIENFSSKIDFEMPYKWGNINFGGKISFTINNSDLEGKYYDIINQINQLYLSQNNIFKYKENNQALYFSFDNKINKKWSMKIGLRMETTQAIGLTSSSNQENKTNYIKLFPTTYLSYQANENNTFNIDFSRRINRPDYWELDPSRWYTGLNSYVIGNPFMQPSFSYNFEFSHAYKNLLVTTIAYNRTKNGFGQLTTFDLTNDTQIMIRENFYDNDYFMLQENANISINKWWTTSIGGALYYSKSNTFHETLAPEYKGFGGDFNTTQSLILNKPKTFLGEISFNYNFPTYEQPGKVLSNYSLDASMKYLMLQNKLSATLSVNNIFKSDIMRFRKTTQNIYQSYNQYYDTQSIRLSVSYKFGNNNLKITERKGSNIDEKNRAN